MPHEQNHPEEKAFLQDMKVVIAHTADPFCPGEGGAVRYSLNLLHYLSKKGIDTTFLGVKAGMKTPSVHTGPSFIFIPIAKGSDTWYWYSINLFLKVLFLRIPQAAVIHTHRLEYMFMFVLLCPRNPKVFLQGSPPLHYARLHLTRIFPFVAKLYQIAESFCLRRIDYLITTEEIKKCYVERYPWISGKICTMPVSAVDLDEFKPMNKTDVRKRYGFLPKDRIIIFLGRLEKVKNLDLLLKAFILVKKQIPEAKLLVVGEGADQSRLKQLSEALGLRDVAFTGLLEKSRIPEIINCADVLALCTLKEGCEGSPTVIREAIACGIPAVSTRVGDVSEVIKNEFLGRVTEWNEESFAEALIEVISTDPERIKQECERTSKDFSFDALAEKIVRIYDLALEARQDNAVT